MVEWRYCVFMSFFLLSKICRLTASEKTNTNGSLSVCNGRQVPTAAVAKAVAKVLTRQQAKVAVAGSRASPQNPEKQETSETVKNEIQFDEIQPLRLPTCNSTFTRIDSCTSIYHSYEYSTRVRCHPSCWCKYQYCTSTCTRATEVPATSSPSCSGHHLLRVQYSTSRTSRYSYRCSCLCNTVHGVVRVLVLSTMPEILFLLPGAHPECGIVLDVL